MSHLGLGSKLDKIGCDEHRIYGQCPTILLVAEILSPLLEKKDELVQ